jgi:nitrous oxidase accessory protein NosD
MEKKIILLMLLIIIVSISSVTAVDINQINNTDIKVDNINQNMNNNTTNCYNQSINKFISSNDNSQLKSTNVNEVHNLYKSSSFNGTIYIVNGSSQNQMDNPTIQNAIDQASNGDTILITGTNYINCHIIINKQLNITSSNGTTMTTCPSNTKISNGLGIFYLTSEASNSIISGFTLINEAKSNYNINPYGIYINGANNILITNCTISSTNGQSILVKGAKNTTIKNSNIKNSIKGIIIENSNNTLINNNYIHENNLNGINLEDNVSYTTIDTNNITLNLYGINVSSADNVYVLNNRIFYNRNGADQSHSTMGAGVYVNSNITYMLIRGNFIYENGMYGVFNDYRVKNLVNQYIQVIDQNFFGFHKQRAVFTAIYKPYIGGDYNYNVSDDTYYYTGDGEGNYTTETGMIFIWSNIYYGELFCGGTSYAPGVLKSSNPYKDLIVGNITQIEKGVYSFSFLFKNNGSVATGLNAVKMIFFLNKNNTITNPITNDIYNIETIKNGTVTTDFRNATYLSSGNNITLIGPGYGSLDGGNRPYAFYNVTDFNIPNNKSSSTILTADNLTKTFGVPQNFTGKLTDKNGNPIKGQHIALNLTRTKTGANKIYWATTDINGEYQLPINLAIGKYTIYSSFTDKKGQYQNNSNEANIIVTKNTQNYTNTSLTADNLTKTFGVPQNFTGKLTDKNGNPIKGQHIALNLTRTKTGANKIYWATTDINGEYQLPINLAIGKYTIYSSFKGNDIYQNSSENNSLIVIKNNIIYIPKNVSNNEIQHLIDYADNNSKILFLGSNYDNISLIINKSLNISNTMNTKLYGINSSSIFTITPLGKGTTISNFNLIALEGNGINLYNTSNIQLNNNNIKNILNSNNISEYNKGYKIMPGNGVSVIKSSNIIINFNNISLFENGVYLFYSNNISINNNLLKKNNYGITFDFNVTNTNIFNNNITENIGNYTLDVPEGPLGYGIYLNNSAVNVNITNNNILNNYIGILVDSNYSTGIKITSNLINENSLEGIVFWKHYDLVKNAVYPIVTDNAIYNNAKGPSMMILGEISANPEGIYGPGQWNDDLKLIIGFNWYGTNHLVTWDLNGTVGAGSICPRIKTSPITFNLTYNKDGIYNVNFYKNGSIDTKLPEFSMFFTLNMNGNEKEVNIINGTGTLTFNASDYKSSGNIIEVSAGSLKNTERIYYVIAKYIIPNNEIPT